MGLDLGHALGLPHHAFAGAGIVVARRTRAVVVDAAERDGKTPPRLVGERQHHGRTKMPANGAGKRVEHQPHVAIAPCIQRGTYGPHQQARSHRHKNGHERGHQIILACQRAGQVEEDRGHRHQVPHQRKHPRHPHLISLVRTHLALRPFGPVQPGPGRCGGIARSLGGLAAAPHKEQQAHAKATKHHHKHHLEGQEPRPQAAVDDRFMWIGRIDPHRHAAACLESALQPPAQLLLEVADVVRALADGRTLALHGLARPLKPVVRRGTVGGGFAAPAGYQLRLQQRGIHRLPELHARPVVQRGQHAQQQHADAAGGKGQRKQRGQPETVLALPRGRSGRLRPVFSAPQGHSGMPGKRVDQRGQRHRTRCHAARSMGGLGRLVHRGQR